MKRVLLLISLVTVFVMHSDHSAYASGAIAGATEPTQIFNNVELLGINISDAATALNTQLTTLRVNFLDPAAQAAATIAQLSTSNGILNLINGGYQGSSLIVGNQQSEVEKEGLRVVKVALGALATSQGPYSSGSIGSNLKDAFKQYSLSNKVYGIDRSKTLDIVQQKACDHNTLVRLAEEDVLANNGGKMDPAAFTKRMQELDAALCAGNPNGNRQLAETLSRLSAQRPDIGGWDAFLAVAGGDNQYAKSVNLSLAISEEMNKAQTARTNELNQGGGLISQKKCLIRQTTNANGEPYSPPESAPCISDVVLNPSGLLKDSLTKATNAGLERLANVQGAGALVGALGSIVNLANGIRSFQQSATTLSSAVGGIGGGGSGGGGMTSTSPPEIVSSAKVSDLAGNPETKESMIAPIRDMLENHLKSLRELRTVDGDITSSINSYEGKLNEVKACFAENAPGDPQAAAFFANRDERLGDLKAKVSDDMSKLEQAATYLSSTLTKIQESQSSKEITDIFYAYQRETRSMPNSSTLAERKGDLTRNQSDSKIDMGPSGELTKLMTRCQTVRSSSTSGSGS